LVKDVLGHLPLLIGYFGPIFGTLLFVSLIEWNERNDIAKEKGNGLMITTNLRIRFKDNLEPKFEVSKKNLKPKGEIF